MAGPVTIDASVFLNAFNSNEEGHETSRAFLERVKTLAIPIICPTLLLPELSATVSRGTQDAKLAKEFSSAIQMIPHMLLVPLDELLAAQAGELAADLRLRGSDAVYLATARRYASTLITLDREMVGRSGGRVAAQFPGEILAEIG